MNRILFVDDEQDVIDSMTRVFKIEGLDILCATNQAQAFQYIEKDYFDLAVVDLFLERDNEEGGFEVARKIKEKDAEIPVIILTAFGTTGRAVKGMKIPVEDFVEKGEAIDIPVLIKKVKVLLQATLTQQRARRGREIYYEKIKEELETEGRENIGKIVAIDLETENYYLAEELLDAVDKAVAVGARHENIVTRKVGYQITHTIGGQLS